MGRNQIVSSTTVSRLRTRWAAIGAAVAISLGAGGVGLVSATASSGERLTFVSIDTCRISDTRPAFQVGPKSSPLGPGETMTVSAHGNNGNCTGIPADAVALSLNVTALNATIKTFLTIFATGTPRPDASSLNPSPGEPPTPNAVTTRLSPAGQFDVYSRAGTVDVFIDVNGYFVDHNHDDRYDTTGEVDAKITAQAALGPTLVEASHLEMEPFTSGTGWFRLFWFNHAASVGDECILAPFDALPGQRVTGASVTYANSSGASIDLNLQVIGFKTTAGPIPGGLNDTIHSVLDETKTVPISAAAILDEMTGAPGPDAVLRAGFRYASLVCTMDAVGVFGLRTTFANS